MIDLVFALRVIYVQIHQLQQILSWRSQQE